MSDTGTNQNNEKVIGDITKDIQEELNISKDKIGANDGPAKTNNSEKQVDKVPSDFEESDTEDKETEESDIDEIALKDAEVTLTLEEKIDRRKEASELKTKGNDEFNNQNYQKAIDYYTQGLRICPLEFSSDRAILYANRAACKTKLERKLLAIKDCTKAIEYNDKYVKAYLRRAKLYEETEKLDECLQDYKKILELDSGNKEANIAQSRLPRLIDERNEKMKTEMLGKLKDLGNVILRPFGLSTENFQLQQDPNSGGYSINFKQNQQ